ncbi:LysR family transcriptional regulator [Streptomyces fildesensis]|uniref:LysR family transcriptional regulator n=1 Tax=Streptomyces fildesensis TaxID=375757 RepID=A0ABW8C404_9ACTN
MTLDLDKLRIFIQVVDCESFTVAARRMFMNQSTVSKQIQKLEASLETVLVDRSGKTIRPTVAGEVLLVQAREILTLADRAMTSVHEVSRQEVAHLVVGGTGSIGSYVLPTVLSLLQQRLPALECVLVVGTAADVAAGLTEGTIGIAVLSGAIPSGEHVTEGLTGDEFVLAARCDHPLSGRAVEAGDLSRETLLLREPGSSTRRHVQEMLRQWNTVPVRRMEMWGTETIKQSIRAGLGVSLMSRYSVQQELREGRMCVLNLTPRPLPRRVVVAYSRDRPLFPAESLMLSLLRKTDLLNAGSRNDGRRARGV